MKNNKKKKHHRSKASKKRRAACEANPEMKARHKARKKTSKKGRAGSQPNLDFQKIPLIDISEIDNHPKLNEIIHSFRVCDLGSINDPGLAALSLVSYVKTLKERLFRGEKVKRNIFLQIGYSRFSVEEWTEQRTMHASGGVNIPVMDLAVPDMDHTADLILTIERSMRETIAQLNESNTENIRTVHITVDECNKDREPTGAFGLPPEGIDPNSIIEQEIHYSS